MVIFYALGFALVLALYGAKAFLLHSRRSPSVVLASFLGGILAAVPIAWLISPDWHNPSVREVANWVGTPLLLLAVPTASFLYDYCRRRASAAPGGWRRTLIEVFIGVPAWGVLWVCIEIFVLRWSSLS